MKHPPMFRWQQFWVPRTGTIDLSDGGFLVDPTSPYSFFEGKSLTQLINYRVLVPLGRTRNWKINLSSRGS